MQCNVNFSNSIEIEKNPKKVENKIEREQKQSNLIKCK